MLSGGGILATSEIASIGIPHDYIAMIHWSSDKTPLVLANNCSSFFLCPPSVKAHLSYSILIISPNDLYSLNGPKIVSRSFLCYSNNFKKPSNFPILSHHPFFFIIANTLLIIFLKFDPPPALLGRPPSWIIINAVLVWSKTTNNSLIGPIACLTFSTGKLTSYDIYLHVF